MQRAVLFPPFLRYKLGKLLTVKSVRTMIIRKIRLDIFYSCLLYILFLPHFLPLSINLWLFFVFVTLLLFSKSVCYPFQAAFLLLAQRAICQYLIFRL